MNYFKLCVIILINVLPAISSPVHIFAEDFKLLPEAITFKLRSIIREGDNVDQVNALLDKRTLEYNDDILEDLNFMIKNNRFRSFKTIFSHIDYKPEIFNNDVNNFLVMVIIEHRPEICDFLLSLDFKLERILWTLWKHETFLWKLEELQDLITRHPKMLKRIAPKSAMIVNVPNVERCILILDFVHHCMTVNEKVAMSSHYAFSTFLRYLVENRNLDDEDMALVITRLLDMGAKVEWETVNRLIGHHTDHVVSYRILLMAGIMNPAILTSAPRAGAMLDYFKSMKSYFPAITKFFKGNHSALLKLSSQTQNLQLLDFILTLCTRQPAEAVLQVASESALKLILKSGDLEAVKKQCKESCLLKISDLIDSYQKIIPDYLQMLMNDIIADFKIKNIFKELQDI